MNTTSFLKKWSKALFFLAIILSVFHVIEIAIFFFSKVDSDQSLLKISIKLLASLFCIYLFGRMSKSRTY